jgi:hypothetical protein
LLIVYNIVVSTYDTLDLVQLWNLVQRPYWFEHIFVFLWAWPSFHLYILLCTWSLGWTILVKPTCILDKQIVTFLGTLIWDNLIWKKNGSLQNFNLGNLLVGNWKKFKINSSFSFLAKRELTNLLGFSFQSPFPWYINSNISILYLKYYNLENSISFM